MAETRLPCGVAVAGVHFKPTMMLMIANADLSTRRKEWLEWKYVSSWVPPGSFANSERMVRRD
jgi:hypothetical protein